MKKILVLADIHANPIALEAVLKDSGSFDLLLNAGDIVDYNPWPLESLARVRELGAISVLGNHDRDSALNAPIGYNPYAIISCRWTHERLPPSDRSFLLALPRQMKLEVDGVRISMFHGSPRNPVDEYITPECPREVLRGFLQSTESQVLILGHTHIPFVEEPLPGRYVLNPGSVGQPRDGDPRASYALLTIKGSDLLRLEHRRVPYDVEKVASEILRVGLPPFLAERLYYGM
ncbi:MAG: YfcE family phosphodiesterase [Candidatus Bathyarchaeia archaeon]